MYIIVSVWQRSVVSFQEITEHLATPHSRIAQKAMFVETVLGDFGDREHLLFRTVVAKDRLQIRPGHECGSVCTGINTCNNNNNNNKRVNTQRENENHYYYDIQK